jgi:RNA polymerase sigma factor (sigma-70 family)
VVAGGIEDALRQQAPQVLGALVRRYGRFDACEDAVQEALLAAAQQWPGEGVPDNPRSWLIRVAANKLTDQLRSEASRRRREDTVASRLPVDHYLAPAADSSAYVDDTLTVLFLCCHPVLSPPSQVALTLRAAGGLTTGEIARAFLVPEASMAKRITRAKQSIRHSGTGFRTPSAAEQPARLAAVLRVLYLIFNEGYTATSGAEPVRIELSGEAIRLTRLLHRLVPADAEVAGLLALMLLTDARRTARTDAKGNLVPLDEQDRSRWDKKVIAEGTGLVTAAMTRGPVGPYQLQAAIAALHDEARSTADTDWPQILALYDLLLQQTDNPIVALNRVVALAKVAGPRAGLAALDALDPARLNHRADSTRAHLLELAGDDEGARRHYLDAARRTLSLPERDYLRARAARLTPAAPPEPR